jgi:hypothetical protein
MSLAPGFKRPVEIRLIVALYLLSPLINVLHTAYWSDASVAAVVRYALWPENALSTSLILMGPVVALGVYSGRLWGLVLFLLHAGAILTHNTVLLFRHESGAIGSIIAVDVVVFAAVVYVLQRDMRAPYLSREARGWRGAERIIRELPLEIVHQAQRITGVTINVSRTGALVRLHAPEPQLENDAQVMLVFHFETTPLTLPARIVRVGPHNKTLGVRFELDDAEMLAEFGRQAFGA